MDGEQRGRPDPDYEMRVVAFLDVLGFSALVTRADRDDSKREVILTIIRTLRETLARNPSVGFEFTQFSDSIVISANVNLYGMHAVFAGCRMLAVNLLQHGVLLRGGISVGNLTHSDDVLFGPGLLTAYRCDARGAPPRIALHTSMKETVDDYSAAYGLGEMIRRDHHDLSPMLDTLLDFAEYRQVPKPGQPVWDGPASLIVAHIDRHTQDLTLEPGVRAKWRWMRDYWNRAVARRNILPLAAVDEED